MTKKNLPIIIIILLTILAGLGSILYQHYPVAGLVLIILGILFAIWKVISTEVRNSYFEKILESQNEILASKGLGNVYQKMFQSEVQKTGKSKRGIALLIKAYKLEPNNLESIKNLSPILALNVSFRSWAADYSFKKTQDDWKLAKQLAEKGLKINPRERILMDALGILYDTAGEHETARKWFIKSSKFRTDPWWHLLMATSWGLSGENSKAISQIELAIQEGAKGWPVELAYGEALTWGGRCEDALYHLSQAKQVRGMYPVLSNARISALCILGRFSISSIIDVLYLTVLLLTLNPIHSLKRIIGLNIRLVLTMLVAISKTVWSITSKTNIVSKIHYKIFSPDSFAFNFGCNSLERGDIDSALNFFEICHSVCPKSARVLQNLSLCHALLENKSKATELINEAIQIEPKNKLLLWNKKQIESGGKLNIRWDIKPSKAIHDEISKIMQD